MPTVHNLEPFDTGFSFDNCKRNALLEAKGFPMPTAQKTGTTIVGIVIKDGVVLGADTRATEDNVVADKYSEKIHYLAKNMYCCGAGTAADTEMTTRMVSSQLKLLRLNTGREVPVIAANRLLKQHLFKYQGYIGAALVLGGVDTSGPSIYCIHPHGSTEKSQFTAMGSGSLAAITHLEANWRPNLSADEGKLLVRNAIASGIFNDLMSGNNIDMCVIQPSAIDYIRPYEVANIKGKKQGSYKYARGTTAVLQCKVKKINLLLEDEQVVTRVAVDTAQPMDQSA